MTTLHLICGLPCSGTSTYAAALRTDRDATLFSLDRWLITMFGRYELSSVGHEEHTRRVLACRELIWESAARLLQRSVDVVLDDGFFLRHHRMRHSALAAAVGAGAKIHYMDAPINAIRERLEVRNARLPAFNFFIDPGTLTGFEGLFEVPTTEEGAGLLMVTLPEPRGRLDVQ